MEPIAAWLIHADGEMDPVCVGIDGINDDATTACNFLRLISPHAAAMALTGTETC